MTHPIPGSAHPGVQHVAFDLLSPRPQAIAGSGWFPDISEFNGAVDWSALEAAYKVGTISGVMMRAGFGTVRADHQFATNQREARARGIPALYYWFCYPAYNTPEAEAAMFNATVGPLQSNEAMCGDFEDDPSARPFPRGQAGLDWCRAFLTALEAPQNATWWYTYPFLLGAVGLQPLIGAWPFWEADYSATPDSAFTPAIARQFTDCGSTPGVGGCCDQSRVLRAPLDQWLTPGGHMATVQLDPEDPIVKQFQQFISDVEYALVPKEAPFTFTPAGETLLRLRRIDAATQAEATEMSLNLMQSALNAMKAELDTVEGQIASGQPTDLTALKAAVATVDTHLATFGKHEGVDVTTGADT